MNDTKMAGNKERYKEQKIGRKKRKLDKKKRIISKE
jgi:hypothetical protein